MADAWNAATLKEKDKNVRAKSTQARRRGGQGRSSRRPGPSAPQDRVQNQDQGQDGSEHTGSAPANPDAWGGWGAGAGDWGVAGDWGTAGDWGAAQPAADWAAGWDGSAPIDPSFSKAHELVTFWRTNVADAASGAALRAMTPVVDALERVNSGVFPPLRPERWEPAEPDRELPPESDHSRGSDFPSRLSATSAAPNRSKQQILSSLARKGIFLEDVVPTAALERYDMATTPATASPCSAATPTTPPSRVLTPGPANARAVPGPNSSHQPTQPKPWRARGGRHPPADQI
jgi:hypothetical protein